MLTWHGLLKEAAAKLVRRPFANSLSLLVASAGAIIMVGPPITGIVISAILRETHQLNIKMPQVGLEEYVFGFMLIACSLLYSCSIHFLSSRKRAQDDELAPRLRAVIYWADREALPQRFMFSCVHFDTQANIPDYDAPRNDPRYTSALGYSNDGYHREWFRHIQFWSNSLPIVIGIENIGAVAAKKLVLKVEFLPADRVATTLADWAPKTPQTHHDLMPRAYQTDDENDITLQSNIAEYRVEHLNAGDSIKAETIICLRPRLSCDVLMKAHIFADALPSPHLQQFEIAASVEAYDLSLQEIVSGKPPQLIWCWPMIQFQLRNRRSR